MANQQDDGLGFIPNPPSKSASGHMDDGLGFVPNTAPVSDPSKLESLLRGVAQGGTLGFADEITGAGEALLDKLGGSGRDLINLYRQHRDESRANYDAAHASNPITSTLGTLAGSIAPALLTAGLSEAPEAAAAAPEALSLGQSLLKGAKIGAGYGALSGVGDSTSDLTQGDIGGLAEDTALSTLLGGAAGTAIEGGIQGLKGLGSFANKTEAGKALSNAFEMGEAKPGSEDEGNLWTKTGRDKVEEEGFDTSGKWVGRKGLLTAKKTGLISQKGRAIANKIKSASEQDVNPSEVVDKISNDIANLNEKDPEEGQDKAQLLDLINNFTTKTTTNTFKTFSPSTTEVTPAVPSAREKLEQLLEDKVMQANEMNQNLRTAIKERVRKNGQKVLIPSTTLDEQIGGAERVTPIEPSDLEDTNPSISTDSKNSWDYSPEGETKARKYLEKLQSKARVKGENPDRFELIKEGKFYHVVENSPVDVAPADVPTESTFDPGNTEDNYKSKAWTGMPVLDTPGTPETSTTIPGAVTEGSVTATTPADLGVPELAKLKQVLNRWSDFKNDKLGSTSGKNLVKNAAGDIGDFLEQNIPGLDQANKDYTTLMGDEGMADDLGIKSKRSNNNLKSSKLQVERLENLITRYKNSTTFGKRARKAVDNAIDDLRKVSPELADQMQADISRTAQRIETARKAGGEGFFKAGSLAGMAMSNSVKLANASGMASYYLTQLPKEGLLDLANSLSQQGELGQKVGNVLKQAMTRDDIGKNALIFTLMQNPSYRELLNNNTGNNK